VRPLLEEWGLFLAFKQHGLGYTFSRPSIMAMRPLHLVPSAMQWLAAAGAPIGVGICTALLLAARYMVARWAVTPVATPEQRWAFATLSTTLVVWPGVWIARFSAAQASAIFFLVALGCSVRLCFRASLTCSVVSAVSVAVFMCIYQAPVVLALTLPLFAFVWNPTDDAIDIRTRVGRAIRVGTPVALGLLLYGAYVLVARQTYGASYEESSVRTVDWIHNVASAYLSTFGGEPLALFALALLLPAFLLLARGNDLRPARRVAYCYLSILALPLSSLVYLNGLYLRDPERTMFPVALGFCLVVTYALGRTHDRTPNKIGVTSLIVVPLLLSSAVAAANARSAWSFQSSVLREVERLIGGKHEIVLQDNTGRLGDVYTFFGSTLAEALLLRGVNADIIICTADGVDRLHPVAQRYPIASTPRCGQIDMHGWESFTANAISGKLRITPN
jgi:hypothetical protein